MAEPEFVWMVPPPSESIANGGKAGRTKCDVAFFDQGGQDQMILNNSKMDVDLKRKKRQDAIIDLQEVKKTKEDDTVFPIKHVVSDSAGDVLWQDNVNKNEDKKSSLSFQKEIHPPPNKIEAEKEEDTADDLLMNLCLKVKTEEQVNSFANVSQIGKGSYGVIHRLEEKQTGASVVVKQPLHPSAKKELASEERNLRKFNHENIVRILGFHLVKYFSNSDKCLIMENANQSMAKFWRKNNCSKPMEDKGERMMAHILGICRALKYLQEYDFVHCDIKPENVCVLSNDSDPAVIKLIDMASCRLETDPPPINGVTPLYLPPSWNLQYFLYRKYKLSECPQPPQIGHKDDIWAAGLVLVYMVYGDHILLNLFRQKYGGILNIDLQLYELGQLPRLPEEFYHCDDSPVLRTLLTKLLTVDASLRWTASEVCAFLEERRDRDLDLHSRSAQIARNAISTVSEDTASLSQKGDYIGVDIDRKKRKCQRTGAGDMVSQSFIGDNLKLRRNYKTVDRFALLNNSQNYERDYPNIAGCSRLLNIVQQHQKHSPENRQVWIDGEQYVNQISTDSFPE